MESERDREISARAYALWEQGGRKDGQADAHWAQAVREIGVTGETASKSRTAGTAKAAPKAPAAKPSGSRSAAKTTAKPPEKSPAKAATAKAAAAKSAAASVKSATMAEKPAAVRASAKT